MASGDTIILTWKFCRKYGCRCRVVVQPLEGEELVEEQPDWGVSTSNTRETRQFGSVQRPFAGSGHRQRYNVLQNQRIWVAPRHFPLKGLGHFAATVMG